MTGLWKRSRAVVTRQRSIANSVLKGLNSPRLGEAVEDSITIVTMNPIIEEEDSDDYSPKGDVPSLAPSAQRIYLPTASPSNDEVLSEVSEEVTPSQLSTDTSTVPDSFNKWLEFKPLPGRLPDNSTGREAFPVLVRGFESEVSPMRKNSITSKDATPKGSMDDSPARVRGEANSFSGSAAEFLRFDKQEQVESDDEENRTRQEGGLLPSIARAMPSALDRVLDRHRQGDVAPEDLLLMAISERDNPQAGRRSSIWALLGRSSKPEETIAQALEEWNRLQERTVEMTQNKAQMIADIDATKRAKAELTERYAELTDTINDQSAKIKTMRKSRKAALDSYAKETESQLTHKRQLEEDHISTLRDTTDQLNSTREAEERWLSRIEELITILISVHQGLTVAKQESRQFSSCIETIVQLGAELEDRKEQTVICLELLGEVMEYFAQASEQLEFNGVFCELLKRLRDTAFEAIEAQKQVQHTATTDPRELLPYTRASAHTLGT